MKLKILTEGEWSFLWRFTVAGMIIIHWRPIVKWVSAVIEFGVTLAIKMIMEG